MSPNAYRWKEQKTVIKYKIRVCDNVLGKESDTIVEADSIRKLVQSKHFRELERRYEILSIQFWERV
jgi:hypothetical protein